MKKLATCLKTNGKALVNTADGKSAVGTKNTKCTVQGQNAKYTVAGEKADKSIEREHTKDGGANTQGRKGIETQGIPGLI